MIWGNYDAKTNPAAANDSADAGSDVVASGFFPGGASLHNTMTPHGPDTGSFLGASAAPIHNNPVFFDDGLAFMFETSSLLKPTLQATTSAGGKVPLDERYAESWLPLPKRFDPTAVPDDVDDVEGKTANLLAWRSAADAATAK